MVHHIRAKDESDFHSRVDGISKISADKHLTSKLGEKGKLEGWVVTLLKDIISFLPGVHMARTSPKRVAKAVAQFAKDHADKKHQWFNTDDQAKLASTLDNLKVKIKAAKGEAYLKKNEAAIDAAIKIIKDLNAKPVGGPGPGPDVPSDPANFPELPDAVQAKKYLFFKVLQEESADTEKMLAHALKNGATVNDISSHGDTALIAALTNNNKTAANFLINQGASTQALSSTKYPTLYYAMDMALKSKTGDTEVLKLLISKRKSPLTIDSNIGPGETVKTYFEKQENKKPGSTTAIRAALNL